MTNTVHSVDLWLWYILLLVVLLFMVYLCRLIPTLMRYAAAIVALRERPALQ